MRKSLGSKRQYVDDDQIALITRTFGGFEAVESRPLDVEANTPSTRGRPSTKKAEKRVFASKIFDSYAFGYRRITIERPLRLSAQLSPERIATLRFDGGKLGTAMQRVYEEFGATWNEANYGDLSGVEVEVRTLLKAEFGEIKETQVKNLLDVALWRKQKTLFEQGQALARHIGNAQHDDWNTFGDVLKDAMKDIGVSLDAGAKKQLDTAIIWTNPEAEPVVRKVLKGKPNPMYGTFAYRGKTVSFEAEY
jgi:type I restriction enzyme M protein